MSENPTNAAQPTTEKTTEKPSILLCGDMAKDHIFVPRKNSLKSSDEAHLFLKWPDEARFTHHCLSTGAVVLNDILECYRTEVDKKVLNNILKSYKGETDKKNLDELGDIPMIGPIKGMPKRRVQWETFSEWRLAEIEDPDDLCDKKEFFECEGNGEKASIVLHRHHGRYESELKNPEEMTAEGQFNIVSFFDRDPKKDEDGDFISAMLERVDSTKENYFILARVLMTDDGSLPWYLKKESDQKANDPPPLFEEEHRKRTVLLFSIDELQWSGFFIEKPVSWEQVFRDTANCVQRIIANGGDDFFAIIVWLKDQGAVIYYKEHFALIFFEKEIDDFSLESGKNIIYGSMLVSQAALTVALAQLWQYSHDVLSETVFKVLETGIKAGLYAKRGLRRTGYDARMGSGSNDHDKTLQATELKFPAKRIAQYIYRVFNTPLPDSDTKSNPDKWSPSTLVVHKVDFDDAEYNDARWNDSSQRPFCSILKEVVWKHVLPPDENHVDKNTDDKNTDDKNTVTRSLSESPQPDHRPFINCVYPEDAIFELCSQIVENGSIKKAHIKDAFGTEQFCRIPFLRMGSLLTYDNNQIGQICDTYNVLKQYRRAFEHSGPLSICVFGPAGSGKSFVVNKMIERLNKSTEGGLAEFSSLSFDLSQMSDADELFEAFHQVRDLGLQGKLPLVFFDEFDSRYKGEDFGWLRFFLAPMESGKFFQKGKAHIIGRAVFVFAGSIASTMEKFREKTGSAEAPSTKGSDFVSRVKGYIEVAGPNPTGEGHNILHFFRRATLLRTTLEERLGLSKNDRIDLNENVLFAFLNAKQYLHGARSMLSIINMSEFPADKQITPSCLYKSTRLDMHVTRDFQDMLKLMTKQEMWDWLPGSDEEPSSDCRRQVRLEGHFELTCDAVAQTASLDQHEAV
ncbi:MAG: ATP-binding protein [Coriobacteriales bacterium]|jgi:hypothetical protein|nr:ATP-binding protein [Coriobacteriales bacterium]